MGLTIDERGISLSQHGILFFLPLAGPSVPVLFLSSYFALRKHDSEWDKFRGFEGEGEEEKKKKNIKKQNKKNKKKERKKERER